MEINVLTGSCVGTEYTCPDHSDCDGEGGCDCHIGYDGDQCDQCATDFTGYPNCVPIQEYVEVEVSFAGHDSMDVDLYWMLPNDTECSESDLLGGVCDIGEANGSVHMQTKPPMRESGTTESVMHIDPPTGTIHCHGEIRRELPRQCGK